MARTDTLPHFLTDVADAIRTKGGTSETIQASTFDTAITNLPSGGGIEEYFNENILAGTSQNTPGVFTAIKKLPAFKFYGASASYMFTNYLGENIDCSNIDTSYPTNNFAYMFSNCKNITNLELNNFVNANQFNGNYMFSGCSSLIKLDIRNMTFSRIKNKNGTFDSVPANCEIIVKNQTEKDYFNTNWSRLTNVKTVEEYENE